MLARAVARYCGRTEARRWRGTATRERSGSNAARDGRSAIGDRQETRRGEDFYTDLASSGRPDRQRTYRAAKSLCGRTVTVRVRFADLHSVTRSVTLDAPISATGMLAEIAVELVRAVLARHAHEKTISLLAIAVSHLKKDLVAAARTAARLEDGGAGRAAGAASPLGGRPRRRPDPRTLRMAGRRIWIGRVGRVPFRSRRIPHAR